MSDSRSTTHVQSTPLKQPGTSGNALGSSNVRHTLFRQEVMLAHGSQWMGAIRLAQPLSVRIVAAGALALALCIIAYITLGGITRKARVTGMTLPANGSLTISSLNAGILARSFVTEGQKVEIGQPLFELSTERQGTGGELSMLIAQQLEIRKHAIEGERRTHLAQHSEKKSALGARLSNIDAELLQLEQELSLAERRLEMAETSLQKFHVLQENGFVSASQVQQKQEELLDLRARDSTLKRTKLQLHANRLGVAAERDAVIGNLNNTLAQIDLADASLRQEMAENGVRKTSLILAPQAGILATITYRPGQAVASGQSLAMLIPQGDAALQADQLEVQLFAPSRMIGFLAAGQTVLIRYQAFPYQKFGLHPGRVVDVSKIPFAPTDLPPHLASTILSNAQKTSPGSSVSEGLFRIRVRLERQTIDVYGRPEPLRPGMTLEADIVQDRRKIWEWIASPLLAVTQR